jgi:hypothetical protein
MFATIRKYTPKPNSMTKPNVEQLRHQLHDTFVPMAKRIDGFRGYYAVNVGDKHLITISLFETQKGAAESTRRAAEFVKQNPLPFDAGTPEVSEGEVVTFAEAGRLVGTH